MTYVANSLVYHYHGIFPRTSLWTRGGHGEALSFVLNIGRCGDGVHLGIYQVRYTRFFNIMDS